MYFVQPLMSSFTYSSTIESLAEAMHGEGDLLMHLSTMGYKLNYEQVW
jgi:hypothetical protein